MHHRLRFDLLNRGSQEIVVGHIADKTVDDVPREIAPGIDSFRKRADRCKGLRSQFVVPLAAHKIIHNGDGMPLPGQIQSRDPSAVAVSSQYGNLHLRSSTQWA